MIELSDFMELVNNQITDGSEYCWTSFGPNAYTYEFYDGTDVSVDVTFDRKTQTVYAMTAVSSETDSAFRWMHPNFIDAYVEESNAKGFDPNQAWDDVEYINIPDDQTFLSIASNIVNGTFEQTHVKVNPWIPQPEMYLLMKQAHDANMGLNDYISEILRSVATGRVEFILE